MPRPPALLHQGGPHRPAPGTVSENTGEGDMSINIQFDEKVMRKTEEPRLASLGQVRGDRPGLHVGRHYTKAGVDPFDAVEWTTRKSVIKEPDGSVVFQVDRCEVPKE